MKKQNLYLFTALSLLSSSVVLAEKVNAEELESNLVFQDNNHSALESAPSTFQQQPKTTIVEPEITTESTIITEASNSEESSESLDEITSETVTFKEVIVDTPRSLAPSTSTTSKTYTVQKGDYLYKIAQQFGITVQQLKTWNKLPNNYVYTGNKLIVSDPTKAVAVTPTKPVTPAPTPTPVPAKPKPTPTPVTNVTAKTYTVQKGDYLYKIAQQNGITVEQLKSWNKLPNNYVYTGNILIVSDPNQSISSESLNSVNSETNNSVQSVLDKYKGQPLRVHYDNLSDGKTAGLNQDSAIYGASVPKIVLVAYAQDLVERGIYNWNTPIKYTPTIYNYPESYAWGGSGTIQYENYQNNTYTLKEVVNRTIKNSDNLGANLLLHHVGYRDKTDFDAFTKRVYGAPKYTRNMTASEVSKVVKYVYNQKEQVAIQAMDKTDYDRTKLDVLDVNTYQKIGAWWPKYNHTTGIVMGQKPFILTVLTNYWEDYRIGNLVKEIYKASQM